MTVNTRFSVFRIVVCTQASQHKEMSREELEVVPPCYRTARNHILPRHLAVYQTSNYKTWRETGALVARINALAAVSNPSTKMSPQKERKTKLGALSNSSYRIANT